MNTSRHFDVVKSFRINANEKAFEATLLQIKDFATPKNCFLHLKSLNSTFLGETGLRSVWEQHREEIPSNSIIVSYDNDMGAWLTINCSGEIRLPETHGKNFAPNGGHGEITQGWFEKEICLLCFKEISH